MAAKQFSWIGCAALAMGLMSTSAQAADPVLSISGVSQPVQLGSMLDLDVLVSGVSDLYGYQFSLSFDASMLKALTVSEGPFLSTAGATYGDVGSIDNGAGTITLVYNTLLDAVPGATGSGSLAHLSFQVIGKGSAPISFSDVQFVDSQIASINVQANGVTVTAVPEPASLALMGAGVLALLGLARRRPLDATKA